MAVGVGLQVSVCSGDAPHRLQWACENTSKDLGPWHEIALGRIDLDSSMGTAAEIEHSVKL